MKTADEILAENDQLRAELTAARTRLSATQPAQVSQSDFESLRTECAGLRADRDRLLLEVANLKATAANFDRSVAAQVARFGIRGHLNAGQQAGQTAAHKPTATEVLLEAKGVASVEELSAKNHSRK